MKEINEEIENAILSALEVCGQVAEGYAAENSEPRGSGRLANSMAHKVMPDEKMVYIGTDVDYAPYVEYGTGIYASQGDGRKTPWFYKDEKGEGHWTSGMKPRHFLKKALSEHREEYGRTIEQSIKSAQ